MCVARQVKRLKRLSKAPLSAHSPDLIRLDACYTDSSAEHHSGPPDLTLSRRQLLAHWVEEPLRRFHAAHELVADRERDGSVTSSKGARMQASVDAFRRERGESSRKGKERERNAAEVESGRPTVPLARRQATQGAGGVAASSTESRATAGSRERGKRLRGITLELGKASAASLRREVRIVVPRQRGHFDGFVTARQARRYDIL